MELIKGRPADETGRLEKEIRVYDLFVGQAWNGILQNRP